LAPLKNIISLSKGSDFTVQPSFIGVTEIDRIIPRLLPVQAGM
jgi:hypothetical protein